MKIKDCTLIKLGRIKNRKGNLSFIQNDLTFPFQSKRIFYLYDVPGGESRGGHSHIACHQFLIALSGSFDVEIDDSLRKKVIKLNNPSVGIHIPPGIWASQFNFSSGSICLVFASEEYLEEDYIRNYQKFIESKNDFRKI